MMKEFLNGFIDFLELEGVPHLTDKDFERLRHKAERYADSHDEVNSKDFETAARPMLKYLCDNHHPHTSVIITPTTAEVVEGVKSIGEVNDYLRD